MTLGIKIALAVGMLLLCLLGTGAAMFFAHKLTRLHVQAGQRKQTAGAEEDERNASDADPGGQE